MARPSFAGVHRVGENGRHRGMSRAQMCGDALAQAIRVAEDEDFLGVPGRGGRTERCSALPLESVETGVGSVILFTLDLTHTQSLRLRDDQTVRVVDREVADMVIPPALRD